jgi:hypothetical protein
VELLPESFSQNFKKLNDMILVLACGFLFAGYMLLSFNRACSYLYLFQYSWRMLPEFFLPRCIMAFPPTPTPKLGIDHAYNIQRGPSMGGFANPIIIKRITNALSPASTAFRYALQAARCCAGIIIAIVTLARSRKKA